MLTDELVAEFDVRLRNIGRYENPVVADAVGPHCLILDWMKTTTMMTMICETLTWRCAAEDLSGHQIC